MYLKQFYFAIKEKKDTDDFDVALKEVQGGTHQAISPRTLYYLDVFLKNQNRRFFVHKNWAAMTFGGLWFWYRGLHMWFFIESLLSFVVLSGMAFAIQLWTPDSFIASIQNKTVAIALFVSLCTSIVMGGFADCIYIRTIQRRARLNKSPGLLSKIMWLLLGSFF